MTGVLVSVIGHRYGVRWYGINRTVPVTSYMYQAMYQLQVDIGKIRNNLATGSSSRF